MRFREFIVALIASLQVDLVLGTEFLLLGIPRPVYFRQEVSFHLLEIVDLIDLSQLLLDFLELLPVPSILRHVLHRSLVPALASISLDRSTAPSVVAGLRLSCNTVGSR